jgi:hypothetical protein
MDGSWWGEKGNYPKEERERELLPTEKEERKKKKKTKKEEREKGRKISSGACVTMWVVVRRWCNLLLANPVVTRGRVGFSFLFMPRLP